MLRREHPGHGYRRMGRSRRRFLAVQRAEHEVPLAITRTLWLDQRRAARASHKANR